MLGNKTIWEAKYSQKGNGDYIPFRKRIKAKKCIDILRIF